MEKVAVNGTVDRKMAGLKGLLVSQNAPFTGSSPQINASYTGLSKSALVSLFESVPYNVGYTKVGNPTIVDGMASGFSQNDYFSIKSGFSIISDTKLEIGFKLSDVVASSKNSDILRCFGTGVNLRFYVTNVGKVGGSYKGADGNTKYISFSEIHLNEYFKFTRKGNNIKLLSSSDNQNWTTMVESDNGLSNMTITSVIFGGGEDTTTFGPLNGSIDLNNTYIKVNGVNWFGPGVTKNLVPAGTVVGDVIVKDGIASGFSKNSIIQISEAIDTTKQFEIFLKIITSNSTSLQNIVNLAGTNSVVAINAKTRFPVFLMRYNGTDGALHSIAATVRIGLENNTSYYLKTMCSSIGISLSVSNDKINWTTTTTSLPSDFASWQPSTAVNLGGARKDSFPFLGSIDLNNIYTKVGSDYFYRGMVPMTKTCSIVGATGTADLTQEDKNIILNKGWSLTVQ